MELRSHEGANENSESKRGRTSEQARCCDGGRDEEAVWQRKKSVFTCYSPNFASLAPCRVHLSFFRCHFSGTLCAKANPLHQPHGPALCELAHEAEEEWKPCCLVSSRGHVSCLPPREENPSSCCSCNRRNLGAANSRVRGLPGTCPFWSLKGNLELLNSTCSVHVLYQKWVFGERYVRVSDESTWSNGRFTG